MSRVTNPPVRLPARDKEICLFMFTSVLVFFFICLCILLFFVIFQVKCVLLFYQGCPQSLFVCVRVRLCVCVCVCVWVCVGVGGCVRAYILGFQHAGFTRIVYLFTVMA